MADRWREPLENFARSRGPRRPRRRYPEPLCHPEKIEFKKFLVFGSSEYLNKLAIVFVDFGLDVMYF